jgi:hypothetical protein
MTPNDEESREVLACCRKLNGEVNELLADMDFIERIPEVEGLLVAMGEILEAVEGVLVHREAKP